MKPTASFIREKITQDAWKVFLHFQVKIRHIIGQTFFTWMYFPTCCCTEQGATCANGKMWWFADASSLQGRPEAQGFRKLAMLWEASYKFCQEEEKASGSLSSSREKRIRIGSSSQWIITLAILRPVQWCRPSTNYTVQRFAYASQESMLLHASVESGICARKAWGSSFQKARTATNICFHLLSPSNFQCPFWQVSLAKRHSFDKKITEAVMFIKKNSTRRHARKHEVLLSLASRLITLVTPDFFDRKVSSCFIQGRKPAQTFNPTWYSRGWRGSGLPDLFAVGTSAGGISPTYQVTYLLGGRINVPHLMSIRPMECWLATLNASSPTMAHALEQTKAARIGVICNSASSKLSASCLHGYSVSIRKIQGFFSGRRYSQHPRLSRP